MSEIGIPFDPDETEPLPLRPSPPAPEPPIEPAPAPGPEPAPEPSPEEGDSGALIGLDKLVLILFVLAFILAGKALTDFLNWLLRGFLGPLWPRAGSPTLNSQKVTQGAGAYLGGFVQDIDPEVGTSFTQMATTTGAMSRAYVALATRILKVAIAVAALEAAASAQQTAGNALRHTVQSQGATIKQTAAQQAATAKIQGQSIHGLGVQVDELQKHITTLIEPELARLKDQIPPLQQGHTATTKRVDDHDRQLGLEAMVGTVAAAMAKMGTSWTRCDTNRQIGEKLCEEGGSNLRNLLHGLMPLVDIAALCGLVTAISAVGSSSLVKDGLSTFTVGVQGLLSCTGATLPPPLPIGLPALAPVQPWASLAPLNV